MVKIESTEFDRLYIIHTFNLNDDRGQFVKYFNNNNYQSVFPHFDIQEAYYSISKKNVIRGMHFQIPPLDYKKIVFVSKGSVKDVVLDIRKNSKTFGTSFSIEINDTNNIALLIPEGFAHGYKSLEENTIMNYLQTSCYSKEHDLGILWNSFSFNWGIDNPIISPRDQNFITFAEYIKQGSHF